MIPKFQVIMCHSFKQFFTIILLFISIDSMGQIQLSKIIKENEFTNPKEHHLVFAEFWATWCRPCIFASKQLSILQEKYSDDIYIYSISGESAELIEKHIAKHDPKLTIASDFDNRTLQAHNKQGLVPYMVVFNQKNDVLWKGNPLELDENTLNALITKNKNTKQLKMEDRVLVKSYKLESNVWNAEVFEFGVLDQAISSLERSEGGMKFQGLLSDFLSEYLQVGASFLKIQNNPYVQVKISNEIMSNCDVDFKIDLISKYASIDMLFEEIDFYEANIIDQSLLWDFDRIDWGSTLNLVLETEEELSINNATIHQFGVQLAKYLKKPVVFSSSNCQIYDWQVPIKYSNLMLDELKHTYGMELVEKTGTVLLYEVSVKQ